MLWEDDSRAEGGKRLKTLTVLRSIIIFTPQVPPGALASLGSAAWPLVQRTLIVIRAICVICVTLIVNGHFRSYCVANIK